MKSSDWIKVQDWIPTKDKMLILYHAFGVANITIATHVDSLFFIDQSGRVLAPTHVMPFALPKQDGI